MPFLIGCVSSTVACPLTPPPRTDLPERGVSAHRGGVLGCPVNTIGAFQRAICRGVHQIELDVRATADDVIVVAHDDHVTGQNQTLHISESTFDQVHKLELAPCLGEEEAQHIPTLEQTLSIMPQNIWINVDIKNNDPHVAKLVAATVAKAHRFDQVIFASRDKAAPAIRQLAEESGEKSMIANMNREFFRFQYIDATINSCAEFIQLVEAPLVPFLRGKPSQSTMDRLKRAGVRVNYSWLSEENEGELAQELQDVFDRGVDFVLVDHVEAAMKAADTLGIPPLVPRWNRASLHSAELPFHCSSTQ
jgi:glycerophosphoryl diester phosphodiesterase